MELTSIPFNKPAFLTEEQDYIQEVLQNGHLAGDGVFTKRCNALLERLFDTPKALLTTSCTHALELSALLVDIQPGDEVIIPSFTFVSTVNAFVLRGAKPVFSDIRPDTLNMDESKLESLITPKTKAIVPVHYAGVGCEMDSILEIAHRYKINVIEDNAHGLAGKYKGQKLGSFGCMATQSFHETKNLSCGEGGALLINDSAYNERAEIIREKGTNRSRFFRGLVDKYTWVDIGSSYLPSEVLAAILCAQLEGIEKIQKRRGEIWLRYQTELCDWAEEKGVRLPVIPSYCEQPFHMFYMLMPSLEKRTRFINNLKEKNILCVFHYLPLNTSDMGMRFGAKAGDCPVTEDISDRLVRLPLFYNMTEDDQSRVIAEMLKMNI
ncbi:MAG: dTDP-4-amino-4,6-dideoxygalactose transaminase [Anaerolinea sp.]|nr:dTDP-4-amino-4,6-dideoxygalactose transaminase [Anaerolinea sp.]